MKATNLMLVERQVRQMADDGHRADDVVQARDVLGLKAIDAYSLGARIQVRVLVG